MSAKAVTQNQPLTFSSIIYLSFLPLETGDKETPSQQGNGITEIHSCISLCNNL